PGQSQTVVFEAIAFALGDIPMGGPLILNANVGGDQVQAQSLLADGNITIKSILTPDWKKIGFRDIFGVTKQDFPLWAWLAVLPLLGALLVGIERLLAAQRQ